MGMVIYCQALKGWTIIDGALVCLGAAPDAAGGDLVTDGQYENFVLEWEWKVDKSSNSGKRPAPIMRCIPQTLISAKGGGAIDEVKLFPLIDICASPPPC